MTPFPWFREFAPTFEKLPLSPWYIIWGSEALGVRLSSLCKVIATSFLRASVMLASFDATSSSLALWKNILLGLIQFLPLSRLTWFDPECNMERKWQRRSNMQPKHILFQIILTYLVMAGLRFHGFADLSILFCLFSFTYAIFSVVIFFYLGVIRRMQIACRQLT